MAKSSTTTTTTTLLLIPCILFISLCVPSLAQQTCDSHTFSTSNRLYASCTDLPRLSSFLHWTYHASNMTADIAFRKTGTSTSNWVAWALNPTGPEMKGSQALVAYQASNGSTVAYTTSVEASPTMQQSDLSFTVQNLTAEFSNGEMTIFATLQLDATLISTNQVWQEGPVSNGNQLGAHPMGEENKASVGTVNFESGVVSGGGTSSVDRRRNVHGVLNAVSWGILMPVGIIIARYLKVFKSAGPAWFYLHVACQSSAYIVGVAGWGTGLKLGSDSSAVQHNKHRNIGIALFCLGTLQVFALLLRPKPDHKYRLYWNIYHHTVGYTTIVLSIINIFEGFDVLGREDTWKKVYIGILIFLGVVAAILEAITWLIVINRKKRESSQKHVNGTNGVNGYGGRTEHTV